MRKRQIGKVLRPYRLNIEKALAQVQHKVADAEAFLEEGVTTMSQPLMPAGTHDERAEQYFVRDLKVWLGEQADPLQRKRLLEHDVYRSWISIRRTSQAMMWDAVASSYSA